MVGEVMLVYERAVVLLAGEEVSLDEAVAVCLDEAIPGVAQIQEVIQKVKDKFSSLVDQVVSAPDQIARSLGMKDFSPEALKEALDRIKAELEPVKAQTIDPTIAGARWLKKAAADLADWCIRHVQGQHYEYHEIIRKSPGWSRKFGEHVWTEAKKEVVAVLLGMGVSAMTGALLLNWVVAMLGGGHLGTFLGSALVGLVGSISGFLYKAWRDRTQKAEQEVLAAKGRIRLAKKHQEIGKRKAVSHFQRFGAIGKAVPEEEF